MQAKRLREFFESEIALSLNKSAPLVSQQQTVKMRCRAFTAMQQSFHSLATDDAVVTDYLQKRKTKSDQLRTLLIENGFKKAAEDVKPAMLSCSEMRVLKSQLARLHGDRLCRIVQPVLPTLQQNAKQPVVLKLSALPATTLRSFQFEIQHLMEEDYLQSITSLLW